MREQTYKNSLTTGRTVSASSLWTNGDGLKHHPLVRRRASTASSRIWQNGSNIRKAGGTTCRCCASPEPEPFLVAYRKGLDWRAYLDERCILGVAAEPSPLEIRPPPPPTTTKKRRSRSTTPPVWLLVPRRASSDDASAG